MAVQEMLSRYLNNNLKAVCIATTFVFFGGVIGGLVHNPIDVPRYASGALAVLDGKNIYTVEGVVYPPLLYTIAAALFDITKIFLGHYPTTSSYLAIAIFATIGALVQASIYLLGQSIITLKSRTEWLFAALLNPFLIFVTILYGQMEVFVLLGIVGAFYGHQTGRHWVSGASIALAAAFKLYPIAFFIPYVIKNWDEKTDLMLGALPVAVLTGLLMWNYYPESAGIFGSASTTSLRPVNLLWISSLGAFPGDLASRIFQLTFIATIIYVSIRPFGTEESLLLIFVPILLFFPGIIEYRWAPFAVGLLLFGLCSSESKVGAFHRKSGWILTGLGTTGMILGTLEGWFEHHNWLVLSITNGPEAPGPLLPISVPISVGAIPSGEIAAELLLLRAARMGVGLIVGVVLVKWAYRIHQFQFD